jgi:hypothetical protein
MVEIVVNANETLRLLQESGYMALAITSGPGQLARQLPGLPINVFCFHPQAHEQYLPQLEEEPMPI